MTEEAGKLAEELKPCPFCGHGQSMVDPWFDDVSKRWAIGCGRCGASSGRSVHAKGSKEAAIRSWNTRPSHEAETQDERQRVVVEWGERAFGVDHMQDKIVRAARFFEEAAEMVQAVGLPRDHAQRAFDHVYSRAPGDPAQEAGGAANTLMALCGAIGLSLDECQRAEIERCLAKDPAHFAARNEAKLREVDATPEAGTQEPVAWREINGNLSEVELSIWCHRNPNEAAEYIRRAINALQALESGKTALSPPCAKNPRATK